MFILIYLKSLTSIKVNAITSVKGCAMQEVTIRVINEIICQVVGLTDFDRDLLYKEYGVFIPSARYQPKYKIGLWDGKIHYFEKDGKTFINLLGDIFTKIDASKYTFKLEAYEGFVQAEPFELIDENYFSDFEWEKGHRLEGQPILLEPHQVNGANALLSNQKGMICYSTGSGKTLISAVLAKKVCERGKFLIIVPSRDLVINTANQLNYLGIETGTAFENDRIEEYSKKCVVTTWQGISSMYRRCKGKNYYQDKIKELENKQTRAYYNHNEEEFKQIREEINELKIRSDEDIIKAHNELNALKDGVIGFLFDEVHTAKSSECKKILTETFPMVHIRWGCTGTIPKDKADSLCLFTAIGPVVESMTAKELQDLGFLATCDIKMIKMKDTRLFTDYTTEYEVITTDEIRMNYIAKYVYDVTEKYGNSLILVNRIKQGEILLEKLKRQGANVVFLQGSDSVKHRTEEYKNVNDEMNKIIIATSQIASTGINMPRLFNLVLPDYGKSFVKVMQSIGRSLRLGSDKNHAFIHDISSTTKYANKHYRERKKFYTDANLPIEEMKWTSWG